MFCRFSMRPVEPFCSLNQLEQKITNASFYDGRGCHQFIVVGILRHLWTIIYLWSPRVCMVLYSLFLDSLVFIMFFKWRPFVLMSLKGIMLFIIARYRLCLNLESIFSFKLMWYLGFIGLLTLSKPAMDHRNRSVYKPSISSSAHWANSYDKWNTNSHQ